jgi:hypothetical protein
VPASVTTRVPKYDPNDPLRRFEADLDTHHETLALWNQPRDIALAAVLSAFDISIALRTDPIGDSLDGAATMQHTKYLDEGFVFAMRWLFPTGSTIPDPSRTLSANSVQQAITFLRHASTYALLFDFHTMYSRDLATAIVDESSRHVRFEVAQTRTNRWFGFAECRAYEVSETLARTPEVDAAISAVSMRMHEMRYRTTSTGIAYDSYNFLDWDDVRRLAASTTVDETLALEAGEDLGGFTVGEFREFWVTLRGWGFTTIGLYGALRQRGVPEPSCVSTQSLHRDTFIDVIHTKSGLALRVVEQIVARLSYGQPTNAQPDIFLQPLIVGERITFSPLLIELSKYERNMLKLMAAMPTLKDIAANLIGSRERRLSETLGLLLAKRGSFDFQCNQSICVDDRRSEIDLLAWNQTSPNELLLVESKAILEPDEVAQVDEAGKKIAEAQQQINEAADILMAMPIEQRRQIFRFVDWSAVTTIRKVVLTASTLPDVGYDEESVPVITLRAAQASMRHRHFRTPSSFWSACRDKQWLQELIGADAGHRTIRVGDVRYEIPVDRVGTQD